jgi:hypothetical protein
MTDIMKLADEYATRSIKYGYESIYGESKRCVEVCKVEAEEARAVLQSAIERLELEASSYKVAWERICDSARDIVAERDALRSQLAISQLIETSQNLGLYDK